MSPSNICACPEVNRFPGTRHVHGYGQTNPRILFFGEAPGDNENAEGKPFVGSTGRILHVWLRQAGVEESECFFDNVIQHRPPDNKINLCDIGAAIPELFRRILVVNPRVIVLLGNTALHCFIEGNISQWRGAYFPVRIGGRTFPCVAAFHPSHIYRQRVRRGSEGERIVDMWGTTVADIRKAWRESAESGYRPPPQQYQTEPTEEEVEYILLDKLSTEGRGDSERLIAADIENLDDGYIDLIGYSWGPGEALVVPTTEKNLKTQMRFWRRNPRLVWQNSPYDVCKIRKDWGVYVPDPVWDTLYMHYILYNYLPHSLAYLISVYCTLPFHKDQIAINRRKYNATDADGTRQVCLAMIDELQAVGQYDLAVRKMVQLGAVLRMKETSPHVDKELMQNLYLTKVTEAGNHDKRLEELTGVRWFNPRSPKQVAEYLYRQMGVPTHYGKPKGNSRIRSITTDDNALDDIITTTHSEAVKDVCRTILRGRRATKLASNYYCLTLDEQGRICGRSGYGPDWKMWGTDSTRYACKDPALQTWPPRARRIIVAPPGKKLVYADLKQIEYRVMAYCSKDPTMNGILDSGKDVHRMTGVVIFGGNEVKITSWQRFLAKFINFGLPYGRGPDGMADQYQQQFLALGKDPKMYAQEIYQDYYKRHWVLVKWFEECIRFARENKYIEDPFHNRRWFLGLERPDEEDRQIRSTIPQSVAHSIIGFAHADMHAQGLTKYCDVVLDLHDALLIELDPSEELLGRIKDIMETERLPGFQTPVDIKVGNDWGELDDRVKPGEEDE